MTIDISPARLLEILTVNFNNEERKDLCFRLSINHEDIQINSNVNPRELIRYCERRKLSDALVSLIKELRPAEFRSGKSGYNFEITNIMVDRKEEAKLFVDFANNNKKQILLLEADGGVGKSRLLREFDSICPGEIVFVPIDLREGGIATIWYILGSYIGWNHLKQFVDKISMYFHEETQREFSISEIEYCIKSILSTDNDEDRFRKVNSLSDLIREDIGSIKFQIIVAFDVYEKSSPEVIDWIENKLLLMLRTVKSLKVIIAGRSTPEVKLPWEKLYDKVDLNVIGLEHWFDYATSLSLDLSQETIAAIYKIFSGRTLEMITSLSTLTQK